MKVKLRLHALAFAPLALMLAACDPVVAERGNLVDPDRLAKVHVGSTKEDVASALGSPTSIGTFDQDYWYYMGQRTEQESFFDPVVTDRRIVVIEFDTDDKVSNIRQYGKDDAEPVDIDAATTGVQGHQTTLAENIFGQGGFGSDKNKKKKDTQ